jgi:poly(A) polymerase
MEVTEKKPSLHQDWIDPHAYGIVKALQKNEFETYLVGGCVRDLLLNIHPKDYDIATMAHPPQVKRLIYMAFIIGKRFRLVLVKRDDQQFEVATFRREVRTDDFPEGDQPFGDNIFGTPEEDARRRDFTINALFYDPITEKLIDYVDGLRDVESRTLRMIGDPDTRLIEDPIRMLRGLRFSHKLGLTIEPLLRASMKARASELTRSVLPRRREELLKILRLKDPAGALMEAYDLGFLESIAPTLHDLLSSTERRDEFLSHLEAFRGIVVDSAEPVQLFAWITYSMLQAARTAPSLRDTLITIDEEVFQRFMRDELGMYRFEQTVLTKAIQLLPLVTRTEEFKRRGERRQLAFMKNEGFKIAMRIAETEYLLSPSQLAFWRTAFDKLSGELSVLEAESKTKRRRRPRRPRKGKGSDVESSGLPLDEIDAASHDGEDDIDDDSDDMISGTGDLEAELDDDFSDIKLSDVESQAKPGSKADIKDPKRL